MQLTNTEIENIKLTKAEQIFHFDKGLKLRVSPQGNKVFYLFYSMHGQRRKYKIGNFTHMNLQQARKETVEAEFKLLHKKIDKLNES